MSAPAVFEPIRWDGLAFPGPSGNKLVRLDQAGSGCSRNHASMHVRDAMTANAICCTPQTTLGAAAVLMAEGRCRTLPVVQNGKTVGMVTDRDICLALAAAQALPSELPVADVMSETLYECHEDDEIGQALETMRRHHVRRLPVLDCDGALTGVLSIDDVLARAGSRGVSYREAVKAFQAIGGRPAAARQL
jgi:CBS domain-containing protein